MRTSVSLPDDLSAYVEATAASAGENNAEAIREVIRHARECDDRVAELEATVAEQAQQIDRLEADVERLQTEKREILAQREEHQALVRAVDRQRTLEELKAEAGVLTRLKWWAFGMDRDEET